MAGSEGWWLCRWEHAGRGPGGRAPLHTPNPTPSPPAPRTPTLHPRPRPALAPLASRYARAVAPIDGRLPSIRRSPAVTRVTALPGASVTISAASSTPTGPPPTTSTDVALARAAPAAVAARLRSASPESALNRGSA